MVSQQIEKIKREYTDKYVVVDAKRPELARFDNIVGQVKTVNMNGRALVEFLDYHLNIGWFDIDLDYLKVVDKPPPKEEKKRAAKKPAAKPVAKKTAPAGEKKLSPLEMARMQGAAGKGAAQEKSSTADILAAARAGTAPAAKREPKTEKPAAAEPAPAKVDRSKMSVADMLAAARAEKAAPAAEQPPTEPEEAAPPVEEQEPAAAAAPAAESGDVAKVDKSSLSVEEMVAYCREKDAH